MLSEYPKSIKTRNLERPLTAAEAREMLDAFKDSHREFSKKRAAFYRACWHVHIFKLYKHFDDMKNDEALIAHIGGDKLTTRMFREACRIYGQFLDRVKTLPEFKVDPKAENKQTQLAAEDYAEELVDKAYHAVGANSSYLGEVARTKLVSATKRDTENNIEELKKVCDDNRDIKKFAKAVRKYGLINLDRSERSAARAERRGSKAVADITDGDKFMLNLRFQAITAPRIVAALEKISLELAMRSKFAQMNSDELGGLFIELLHRNDKTSEIPRDLEARKRYAVEHTRLAIRAVTGAKNVSDEQVDKFIVDASELLAPFMDNQNIPDGVSAERQPVEEEGEFESDAENVQE